MRLLRSLRSINENWNPFLLRRRLAASEILASRILLKCQGLEHKVEDLQLDRSEMMQLRVYAVEEKGATGFGVTAFIRDDVLTELRVQTNEVHRVASKLVVKAIKGLWDLRDGGNPTRILFNRNETPYHFLDNESNRRILNNKI